MRNSKSSASNCKRNGQRNKGSKQNPKLDERMESSRGDINDVSYYFSDPNLISQFTSLSFSNFTGDDILLSATTHATEFVSKPAGIATLHVSPAAGFSKGTAATHNGINLAALQLYTRLSANNAKTTGYAPQDLSMLMLAVGQLCAMSSYISRFFGTVGLYSQRNRDYPLGILRAMGIYAQDFVKDMANYRMRFNTLTTLLNQVAIPLNIPYFRKCSNMFSSIYLDQMGSAMAQTYLFVPATTWVFDEDSDPNGSMLKTVDVYHTNTARKRMSELLDIYENMINALLNSSTLNVIYSDILRVSEKEGLPLMHFATIPVDYAILPVYNGEIRNWINNATIMGHPTQAASGEFTNRNDVVSDPASNAIKYAPQFVFGKGQQGLLTWPLVNFDHENPTPDEIVEATRLVVTSPLSAFDNNNVKADSPTLCDYYVETISMDTNIRSDEQAHDAIRYYNMEIYNDGTGMGLTAIKNIGMSSQFDWAPYLYVINNTTHTLITLVGDLQYYTTLDYKYLKALQDIALFGLFSLR